MFITLTRRFLTRRSRLVVVLAALAVMLPAAVLHLSAQDGPMTLTVEVYDSSGAVLPGVAVEFESALPTKRNATTDASGRAAFDAVATGEYTLGAALPGFRPLRTPFRLSAARDWHRAMTLQIGDVMETITVTTRRTSQPTPPGTAGVAGPRRIGGDIRPPRKLADVRPEYPQAMRDAGLEGMVPMEALIAKDGTVAWVRVSSAQVHPALARAAEEAVRQWRYSPTLLNGEPVEVRMTVAVTFRISD